MKTNTKRIIVKPARIKVDYKSLEFKLGLEEINRQNKKSEEFITQDTDRMQNSFNCIQSGYQNKQSFTFLNSVKNYFVGLYQNIFR